MDGSWGWVLLKTESVSYDLSVCLSVRRDLANLGECACVNKTKKRLFFFLLSFVFLCFVCLSSTGAREIHFF